MKTVRVIDSFIATLAVLIAGLSLSVFLLGVVGAFQWLFGEYSAEAFGCVGAFCFVWFMIHASMDKQEGP